MKAQKESLSPCKQLSSRLTAILSVIPKNWPKMLDIKAVLKIKKPKCLIEIT